MRLKKRGGRAVSWVCPRLQGREGALRAPVGLALPSRAGLLLASMIITSFEFLGVGRGVAVSAVRAYASGKRFHSG